MSGKTTTRKKRTSEVGESTEKVSTDTSEVDKITLDSYLKRVKVNPGLVASFRVEARADESLLVPKSVHDWEQTLIDQSKKVYE